MYQAIKKYCESSVGNGLFLLDMPTGSGKTHQVLDYIYDETIKEIQEGVKKKSNKKKYFFITSLKKNLPIKELYERFATAGQEKEFHNRFLFLNSNMDYVLEGLTPALIKTIPDSIKRNDEFNLLKNEVETINRFEKSQNPDTFIINNMKENLRLYTEPAFRKLIEGKLKKTYKTSEERLYAIKTDYKWKWLGKLYPSIFINEKQIIFMSTDKFMARNSTLIEPSYLLYNSNIFNDSIVFIDEFDAAKETMLKNIINTGLKDRIDYIDFFKAIHAALQTNDFPVKLLTPSKERKESATKYPDLQMVITNLKGKADELYERYFLKFSYKTKEEEGARNFLFQDFDYLSILDNNKKYINIINDQKNKINSIAFLESTAEKENSINMMLGQLRGFISYFRGGIGILATNYLQCKRDAGHLEYSKEMAVKSVLAEFHLHHHYIEYLTNQIMTQSYKSLTKSAQERQDLTFYNNGFRFYSFEDNPEHDMHSKIMFCNFTTTPERILLNLCERAKVIGISATATLSTVIGNFDIDYLKDKLQENFVRASDEDKARMQKNFKKATEGYKDINIHVELFGSEVMQSYSMDSWSSIFNNQEFCEETYQMIERELPGEEELYNKARYFRIARVYKEFLSHDDIKSFLCILTKHPRVGDRNLDYNVIRRVFQYIVMDLGLDYRAGGSTYVLDGNDYETVKEEITQRLASGDKLFVISVYQTVGAGQNLQYSVPYGVEKSLIKTNEIPSRNEKDFDAIYLDKPTNLLVNLDDNVSDDAFAKYVFDTLYLQDAWELSRTDTVSHIKKAFKKHISKETGYLYASGNIYNCQSVLSFATRVVIQAVGRICRTNLKQKNIYIYADDRISDCLIPGLTSDRMLNPEFEELYSEAFKKNKDLKAKDDRLYNKADTVSRRANRHIRNLLNESWTVEKIEEWNDLRLRTLMAPCVSEEEAQKDFVIKNFYVELPEKNDRLYYKQEEDYGRVQVSFVKDKETPMVVSAASAKLDRFMQVPLIKQYFEECGFATEFKKSNYILSPICFNNIYKGALGEVIGKLLLNKILSIELVDIEEPIHYELFDFKVKNKPIYVDFKNWHETTVFDDSEMLNKIEKKAKICGCKCAFIINILAGKEYRVIHKKIGELEIIEIPALLIDKANRITYYDKAWEHIRRVVNELSDQNE